MSNKNRTAADLIRFADRIVRTRIALRNAKARIAHLERKYGELMQENDALGQRFREYIETHRGGSARVG